MKTIPAAKRLLASRFYPWVLQGPTLIIFGWILYSLLSEDSGSGNNFGTVFTWVLWWPALGVMFFLAGRIWCTVCPFSLVGDWVQRAVGNYRPVPKVLKHQGAWLIIALFILLTWCENFFNIVHSTLATAVLLLLILTGVIAAGAFFERRTWCRYLCPLGGMAGIYSRTSFFQLRGNKESCLKCYTVDCYKGGKAGPGCSMFEFPRVIDSTANCNFCGACVKNCPNDSLVLSARFPASELWSITRPRVAEAFLAAIMAGLLLMLNTLEVAEGWLPAYLGGGNADLGFTILYLASLAMPVLILLGVSTLISIHNQETTKTNFARFGYAFIPVVLAAHIGHTGSELLEKAGLIPITLGLFLHPGTPARESLSLLGPDGRMAVQFLLYGAGLILSFYTAWRIAVVNYKAEKRLGALFPHIILLGVFTGLNILLILAAR